MSVCVCRGHCDVRSQDVVPRRAVRHRHTETCTTADTDVCVMRGVTQVY